MNKTDQQKNNTYIDYWTKTGKSSKEANQSIKIAKTVTYTDKSGTKRTRTTFQHPILKDITGARHGILCDTGGGNGGFLPAVQQRSSEYIISYGIFRFRVLNPKGRERNEKKHSL